MMGKYLWFLLILLLVSCGHASAIENFKVAPNSTFSYSLLHGKMDTLENEFWFLGKDLQIISVKEGNVFTISSGSLEIHDSSTSNPYITIEMSNGTATIQRDTEIYGKGYFIVSDLNAIREHLGQYNLTSTVGGNTQTSARSLLETSTEIGLYDTFDFVLSNGTLMQHFKSILVFSKNDGALTYFFQETWTSGIKIELEFLRVGYDLPATQITSDISKSSLSLISVIGVMTIAMKRRHSTHQT